jgi:D-alanyl-D-alanine-carboxypeptidase/D-alanyl-D-alanine-endopeptidase
MKILAVLLTFAISTHTFAQQSDNPLKSTLDTAVHKFMTNYMKSGKRVAASIGVNYNGKSYAYNYGETSPGSGKLPTNTSTYEIGSITKTFTGLLVAHAITEKKISLNDDIRKFIPGSFLNLQYPNGDAVKIAYLLAHTSQFPNSFNDILDKSMSKDEFLNKLHQIKLDSLKTFRYAYSNVGYQLLGYILENVYKQSYPTLVEKYITKPLSMLQTKIAYTPEEAKLLLNGYGANKEPVSAIPNIPPASGSLHSSVSDMLKYAHFQSLENTQEVKLTHQPIIGDIDKGAHGFQWEIGKNWSWDQYIRIDGGTNGFRSFCVVYPLTEASIIILTNQKDDSAGAELYKAVTGIYNAIKKQLYSKGLR